MIKCNKIHKDARGAIYNLVGDLGTYPEVTIFFTKRGLARGGCIHSLSCEHICVLVGEIKFVYGEDQQDKILRAGDSLTIPPTTPHYFVALEDSVVMEWGPQMSEKNEKHLEFRNIVDLINAQKDS